MGIVDFVLPPMGESIMEATILKWHKKVGETIAEGETLVDVATDKVDSELPCEVSGIVKELLCKENDVVAIGTVVARIETNKNNTTVTLNETTQPATTVEPLTVPTASVDSVVVKKQTRNSFYSPLVLSIAQAENIDLDVLENVVGTGANGRINKSDLLGYIDNQKNNSIPKTEEINTPPAISVALPVGNNVNVEIVAMDRMRKLIAKHMIMSKQVSPHVTSFVEADVTNMVLWRNKNKISFEKTEGTKITYMPMFLKLVARTLQQFPFINASVDGEKILLKKEINIGMATALPNGNLIVPVIKCAHQQSLAQLAHSVNNLATAARNNKLQPKDTQDGTFTVSNLGTFNGLMGTPIINQPQVAILALGIIKKRPVVLETPIGDVIAIRHIMYLSLSYDHRIVDGSMGTGFLSVLAKEIENWEA